ncbi:MAG: 16S rRNA processing protein RimM [Deltaproteobacteria bacterium]|nr:16S rRNA processing protein RimM [Deltaproteobacteria bacterium]
MSEKTSELPSGLTEQPKELNFEGSVVPKESEEKNSRVAIGKIVGTHGVKGELKLLPYVPRLEVEDFATNTIGEVKTFYINGKSYTLKGRLRAHKGVVLLKCEELRRKEEAELLQDVEVFVEDDTLTESLEGEHYAFELIGLKVVTEDGASLGIISEIITTGANDVYVVDGKDGEVLIPATEEVVVDIDVEKKILKVKLLPGLIDLPKDEPSEDK